MNAKQILDLFTEKDGFRWALAMPHRANGYLYASNGRAAVRIADDLSVECIEKSDSKSFIDLPVSVESLLSRTPEGKDYLPVSLPDPELTNCKECDGLGYLDKCPDCDGDGEFWHGRYEYECKECEGHGRVSSKSGSKCDDCDGTGKIEADIKYRGAVFSVSQIRAIAALPSAELANPAINGTVRFRFTGGEGLIVPLNTSGN